MVELLTLGGIKFVISKIIDKISNKYCLDKIYKVDPELIYYSKEKEMDLSNKIICNILLYLVYCIPHFSDILLALNAGKAVATCSSVKHNIPEAVSKLRTKRVSPINKASRIEYNRRFYDAKSIKDSLILEGASEAEMDKVLSDTRKELGRSFDDEEVYNKVKNNVSNMRKLKRYAGKVINPTKLYKDTKDNEITDIFIPDDDLERLVVHMNLMYSSGEFERSKTYNLKK